VHVLLVKLPPDELAVHVIVPVGAWGVPGLLSVTVTARVVGVAPPTDALLGLTVVLVVLLLIVRVAEAELFACELSPE
jgi:hypothetical protein